MSGGAVGVVGWRRRAMAVIVTAVVLWPLGHRALVVSYEVDPWELFGWAMYSQPAGRVQVRAEVVRAGETSPLRAMGPLAATLRDFARRRSALGRLASPAPLVDAVFASDRSIERVVLVLRRVRLDPGDARLHGDEARLVFERGAPGAARAQTGARVGLPGARALATPRSGCHVPTARDRGGATCPPTDMHS